MKIVTDHLLIKKILAHTVDENMLREACSDAKNFSVDEKIEVIFDWNALFEYLDLELIFKNFPKFNDEHPLFHHFLSILEENDPNVWMNLFDQLFALCLTDVKNMQEINQAFLITEIQKKREASNLNVLFEKTLVWYERLLSDATYHTIHDLTLYLAFDRVCVSLATLFEHPSPNKKIIPGLKVLRDCLIESFQHITLQGRTAPSFFRLIEAIYAYEMRDENLDNHTEEEWLNLCQSSRALRPREELIDVKYIDYALRGDGEMIALTSDSDEVVKSSYSLASYVMQKLKQEVPGWSFSLKPIHVIHFP